MNDHAKRIAQQQSQADRRPHLLQPAEVCKLIRISPATLNRRWTSGEFPPPVRIGRLLRWDVEEIQEWLAANRVQVEPQQEKEHVPRLNYRIVAIKRLIESSNSAPSSRRTASNGATTRASGNSIWLATSMTNSMPSSGRRAALTTITIRRTRTTQTPEWRR